MGDSTNSLFFYGTLMHPSVLSRVVGHPAEELVVEDAILEGFSRHHVKQVDYPAVVDARVGASVLGRTLNEDEASVRGSLVQGLSDEDVAYLDEFEGDEYIRAPVSVLPLTLSSTELTEPPEPIPCYVYLWTAPTSRLSNKLWSYQDFLKDNLHKWVGAAGEAEYLEVDRRREMKGIITPPEVDEEVTYLEGFGKEFGQKYWAFEEGWTNLNHGSYGAAPKPVVEAYTALQKQSSCAPDRFMRIEYMPLLVSLRAKVANLVGCDRDDLVMINNATTGINTVLNNLTTVWEKGDKFLYFSTTMFVPRPSPSPSLSPLHPLIPPPQRHSYDACASTLQYVIDTYPHLQLSLVPIKLEYPVTHQTVLKKVKETIEEENRKGDGKIKLALIDAISSNPGVVVPWEDIVPILRSNGIISLIDAAHQIGQLPVTLSKTQPDYWVANCHKWLFAQRGCAVLYVAKPNQHLIHALPIGHSYKQRTSSLKGDPTWVDEFEVRLRLHSTNATIATITTNPPLNPQWNGTIDWSPILSLSTALEFREKVCGGEERITAYCHKLAKEGGELVAAILETKVMKNEDEDVEGELVGNMVNVLLPIKLPPPTPTPGEQAKLIAEQKKILYMVQINSYKTIVPAFVHADQWWVRLSAQVYNDLSEFKRVGEVLKEVCESMERGEEEEEGGDKAVV